MADLMVSYAREDAGFVRTLQGSLQAQGRSTWIDWEDLAPTAPVRQEIFDAIAEASAVVLVLTPDWVESTYCRQEFDHALHLRKRLIPLLVRGVDESKVPPQLADINWIRFDILPLDKGIAETLRAFTLDLDRLHTHARLYRRAEAWSSSQDESILLRGTELANAERWLATAPRGEGEPTPLHVQFILQSRRAETSRGRRLLAGVSIALVVMIALAVTALLLYRSAEARRKIAQSRLLASEAVAREGTQLDVALLLASDAYKIDPTVEAQRALLRALDGHRNLRRILHGARGGVEGVAVSADGSLTAAGDSFGQVLVWRTDTGALVGSVPSPEPNDIVTSVAFSPAGAALAAGNMSYLVRVFAINGQRVEPRASWKESAPVQSIAYSDDGRYLAVGDILGLVHVYDANAPGSPQFTFATEREAPATALAFSRSSHHLAIGRGSRRISVHPLDSAGEPFELDQGTPLTGLAFAFDDRILMAAGAERIRAWDLIKRDAPPGERTVPDRITSFAVGDDGGRLVAGLVNGEVHVLAWRNPGNRQVFRGHGSAVRSAAIRGNSLATGGRDTVLLWSLAEVSPISTGVGVHRGTPSNGAFDPSGNLIASGDAAANVVLWNHAENRLTIHSFGNRLEGIDGLSFSPDARLLAVASEDSGVLLWDVRERRDLRPPDKSLRGAVIVAFGRGMGQVLVITTNGTSALVDIRTGSVRRVPPPLALGRPMSFAIDAERRMLAFGTNDGYVAMVDLETGRYHGTPHQVKANEVMGLAFLDATRLVGALTDGSLFVWDSRHVEDLRPIPADSDRPTSLAHSAAGHVVAVGNNSGLIQLWDTQSWRQIGPPIQAHTQAVQTLAFGPDGVSLASNSTDGQLKVWNLDPKRWAGVACSLANRQLTAERSLFDLGDVGDCVPSSPDPPWRQPVYPPGFIPIAPKEILAPGATRAIV